MRKRTQAREYALQLLYKIDLTRDLAPESLDIFPEEAESEKAPHKDEILPETKEFIEKLVRGTVKHLDLIDKKISSYAANWELARMAIVDRNILRMGSFELLYMEDIPPKVSINEAVDLAKKYSGDEAGKFVNGILDRIKLECAKK